MDGYKFMKIRLLLCLLTLIGWNIQAQPVSGPTSATDNAVPKFSGTSGKRVDNTGVSIDDNNVLSAAATSLTETDLNGGTALTINRQYFDDFAANRTLTFSGSPTDGNNVYLKANVTVAVITLTIPTSYRLGSSGSTTSIILPQGNHILNWRYADGKWWLFDSAGILDNLGDSVAPTVNDDSADGYSIGSIWLDSTADLAYIAVDVTAGAAVWKPLTPMQSSSFTLLEPDLIAAVADELLLFHVPTEAYPNGITIRDIIVSTSSTCTDIIALEEKSNNGTSISAVSTIESITLSGTRTEDDGSLTDSSIAADNYVYVDFDASPDNINYMTITITFTINP